jgi:hypothetical protein
MQGPWTLDHGPSNAARGPSIVGRGPSKTHPLGQVHPPLRGWYQFSNVPAPILLPGCFVAGKSNSFWKRGDLGRKAEIGNRYATHRTVYDPRFTIHG